MNLEEAIKHSLDKAKEYKGTKCGEEHLQLAKWLQERKNYEDFLKFVAYLMAKSINCKNCELRVFCPQKAQEYKQNRNDIIYCASFIKNFLKERAFENIKEEKDEEVF